MEPSVVRIHGRDVAYRAAGTGPAVVLIHGMASTSATWEPVIPLLAREWTVVAPDLPGHGGSSNPGGDYSLGAHASAVRDLMVALDIPRATFAGHSLGGGVAMQAAYQFPDRCERLALVSSGGLGKEVAWYLRALSLPGAELVLALGCAPRVVSAGRSAGALLRRAGLRPGAPLAEIARCYGTLERPEARTALLQTLRSVVGAGGQRVGATDRLALAAAIPTLIVWGERDTIIPIAHGRAAHEAIPGSRLAVLEDAGHFPHAERPDAFADVVSGFVRDTVATSITDARLREMLERSEG